MNRLKNVYLEWKEMLKLIKLIKKEMTLAVSPISYIFILFGLMAFLPGYPILLSSFFVCLGIFQSFQYARESNDIMYTVLLPVTKSDIIKAKYIVYLIIEMSYFLLTVITVLIRMTILSEALIYINNKLMNANFVYLGFVLLILGMFNLIFVGGFFKTAYKFSKPFVEFVFASFFIVCIGETLFHIPKFMVLNDVGFKNIGIQMIFFVLGIILFSLLTVISYYRSIAKFNKIDL